MRDLTATLAKLRVPGQESLAVAANSPGIRGLIAKNTVAGPNAVLQVVVHMADFFHRPSIRQMATGCSLSICRHCLQ